MLPARFLAINCDVLVRIAWRRDALEIELLREKLISFVSIFARRLRHALDFVLQPHIIQLECFVLLVHEEEVLEVLFVVVEDGEGEVLRDGVAPKSLTLLPEMS